MIKDNLLKENILVTGGAGYIGSHTLHYLIQCGFDPTKLIVFDSLEHGNPKYLPENVKLLKGNLTSRLQINKVFKSFKIDTVLHFAGYAYVNESIKNPGKYFKNNISGGINLLEAMLVGGCKKIVFSSSCAVYGAKANGLISEKTPLRPINPYGESKAAFERILGWYQNAHNIKSISLRYFNAGGADFGIGEDHQPETHLIPLVILSMLKKQAYLKVYGSDYPTGDGTCIRDYIHVTDLADAHFKAMKYLAENIYCKAEYINLGTGKGTSILDIIKIIEKISNLKVPYKLEKRRKGDPAILIADSTKAYKKLHWKAKFSIEDIIKSALKWYTMKN